MIDYSYIVNTEFCVILYVVSSNVSRSRYFLLKEIMINYLNDMIQKQ